MHLVVYNMSGLPKVDWVDDLVVSIVLVSVQVLGLSAVAGIVEKEGIVRPRVLYQPVHCPQYVHFRGLAHRVLLVIREDHHVLPLVAEMPIQICRHVLHIVDAPPQLAPLAEIVYAYEQGFPPAGAVGVLEGVAPWCAMTKCLLLRRGRGRRVVVWKSMSAAVHARGLLSYFENCYNSRRVGHNCRSCFEVEESADIRSFEEEAALRRRNHCIPVGDWEIHTDCGH